MEAAAAAGASAESFPKAEVRADGEAGAAEGGSGAAAAGDSEEAAAAQAAAGLLAGGREVGTWASCIAASFLSLSTRSA